MTLDLDPTTAAILERFGFDEALFEHLRARVADGTLSPASNVVGGSLGPPTEDDLTQVPEPGSSAWQEARRVGVEALSAGRVAQVVLGGGMATRFGSVVKGTVEALDGKSFLEWKLGETDRLMDALDVDVPIALMTSFATDEQTRAHVSDRGLPTPLWFSQSVSLRLSRDGSPFRETDGHVSPYAPGHGDLLRAIRTSGVLAQLRDGGVTTVCVSNVDNLGARVDPVLVGLHILGGRPLTVEVAEKGGDVGGAPVRVDGRLRLVEAPCFPQAFDQSSIPVFNTNTATIEVEALAAERELTWLYIEKHVDGGLAVQLEHLYHELSAMVPTTYVVVPRHGPRGRFFPIKAPDDLARSRAALRELLAATPA
jgi:UTP--glucose-1-phosphate uridylyltransferase